MAYIEVSDLINGLSQREHAHLVGDEKEEDPTGVPELEAIAQWAIDSASNMIDAYIAVQTAVPLDPAPAHIKNMALNMSKYYLFLRRQAVPEAVSDEYDRILKMLQRMSEGGLPIIPTEYERDTVFYGSEGRLFNDITGI